MRPNDITPNHLACGVWDFFEELNEPFIANDAVNGILDDLAKAPDWASASREVINLLKAVTARQPLQRCECCREWFETTRIERMYCDHCAEDTEPDPVRQPEIFPAFPPSWNKIGRAE